MYSPDDAPTCTKNVFEMSIQLDNVLVNENYIRYNQDIC